MVTPSAGADGADAVTDERVADAPAGPMVTAGSTGTGSAEVDRATKEVPAAGGTVAPATARLTRSKSPIDDVARVTVVLSAPGLPPTAAGTTDETVADPVPAESE